MSRCAPCRWATSSACRPPRLRELAIGALLHDVGKLSVPDEILKKPSGLTDEEFAVIRATPSGAASWSAELGGFSRWSSRLVLDHHERLDGSGYPRGLHGRRGWTWRRACWPCATCSTR